MRISETSERLEDLIEKTLSQFKFFNVFRENTNLNENLALPKDVALFALMCCDI